MWAQIHLFIEPQMPEATGQVFTEPNGFINAIWMVTNTNGFMQGDRLVEDGLCGKLQMAPIGILLAYICPERVLSGMNNSLFITQAPYRIWFGTNNTFVLFINYRTNWIIINYT
jgi:hypothetical protein